MGMNSVRRRVRVARKEDTPDHKKSYGTICVRCRIYTANDINNLNNVIHAFNIAARENNYNVHLARISQKTYEKSGVTVIDISVCSNGTNTVANIDFYLCKEIVTALLTEAEVEFSFIDRDASFNNTIDEFVKTTDDDKFINFERSVLGDDVFDTICNCIDPELDFSDVISIRIPCNGFAVTSRCNNHKNETEKSAASKNEDSDSAYMILYIFDKNKSNEFDKFVEDSGNDCIKDIVADYTESTKERFFRAIHMHIPVGDTRICKQCTHFGVVKLKG